jgi:hypothetical protein
MTVKVVNDLDRSDDVSVELGEVLRWNPILAMSSGAHRLHLKLGEVVTVNVESENESFTAVASVPIPSDLYRVFLIQNRIKLGCSGSRGGKARHPLSRIKASSVSPVGRKRTTVSIAIVRIRLPSILRAFEAVSGTYTRTTTDQNGNRIPFSFSFSNRFAANLNN